MFHLTGLRLLALDAFMDSYSDTPLSSFQKGFGAGVAATCLFLLVMYAGYLLMLKYSEKSYMSRR